MSEGHISPLELVGEGVNLDDSDLTFHVSPPEDDPAQLVKDLATTCVLERSVEISRPKTRKIMAGLPESPPPSDQPIQTTWTASHEIDVAFNKLYPSAMYAFGSTPSSSSSSSSPPPPPAKRPRYTRDLSRRSTRSESPPYYPSYRHLRRNAIIPPLSPEHNRHSSTAISRVPAITASTTRPPTPSSTSSPFMDLPGELKNRIYFYSLARPDNIEITAANWNTHQPALLKTCKQIRHEALPIFYNDNSISANIDDWSPAVKNACHVLWERYGLSTARFSHYFTGKPDWGNLLQWLHAFFLGTMKGISDVVNKNRALERKTVGVMFLMASSARVNRTPWAALSEMLEAQRGLLAKGDGRWLLSN